MLGWFEKRLTTNIEYPRTNSYPVAWNVCLEGYMRPLKPRLAFLDTIHAAEYCSRLDSPVQCFLVCVSLILKYKIWPILWAELEETLKEEENNYGIFFGCPEPKRTRRRPLILVHPLNTPGNETCLENKQIAYRGHIKTTRGCRPIIYFLPGDCPIYRARHELESILLIASVKRD